MSEECLERLENLMMDLIKMVATNNSMLVELKADVEVLKSEVVELKKNQAIFKEELFIQSERIDENHKESMKKLSEIALNANYAVSMVMKHDKDIFALKERMSI